MGKLFKLLNKSFLYYYVGIFIVWELLVAFLLQITPYPFSSLFSFFAILTCFLFALSFFRIKLDYLFTILALLSTVVADVFLVLCNPLNQLAGMVAFLFAQTFYAIKLTIAKQKLLTRIILLSVRLLLTITVIILTVIVLKDSCDALAIISVVYYVNLALNAVYAFICHKYLFAVGLVLFALCDICIGLQVMAGGYLPIPSDSFIMKILYPGFNLPWVFYLPSQVVIALSVFFNRKTQKI